MVRAVFFDVGETLVDETRSWTLWAQWLGVPTHTFFAALGAVIERRQHHRAVFDVFRPGFEYERENAAKEAAGLRDALTADDFYPDALPCLQALRRLGVRLGLAGNQPTDAERALAGLGLPVDVIASSVAWGVEKPSPQFFRRVCDAAGCAPGEIAYVGDRVDNDVVPAAECGMIAIFLRRGPWGHVQSTWPEAAQAHARLDSLGELPEVLRAIPTR